ncbi:PAS domain S-box protein [Candidatus Nitrospira nitrificans]|uniref:histidine kinase n=1 Tax=Candidatus Nitrospira nitrificans TaxID=1742973 RepID=A0A0S4L7P3_9BACT|nr:PAS domain S-box protein [Candidatus Nitrospira nitrificans]CUS33719.1 hypothetical protein COMA2_140044 [Candidatus Nitrospira nitrificans]
MNPTSHRPELDLLRRQVADLARELAERDRVLHEQTRHLEVAQALAHLGSWSWDIASGEVEWSDELYRIFGYEPRSRAVTFDSFVSAILPDDHDRVLASIDDALAGVAAYDLECRVVRPDGEVRTIHCCGEVGRDSGGQPRRMSGTALDITDRKRAELVLQQREAHFRALIEHSSDVIIVFNLDGTIRYESPSVERWLGYAQHELNGRSAVEFVHHEDLPAVTEKFHLLVQQPGTPQFAEFRFHHKSGVWRNFEGIGRIIRDSDGRCGVIVNAHDISERKRVEAMLRASQEKLRQALRASGIGLWDWNTETNDVVFSDEWKRQLGYEPEEIADSFEAWTARLHPEDRDAVMAYVRDYVSRREGDYRQEFRLRHKDGQYRWIEARASFVAEADGRQIRVLGSHVDITDRRLMEESVRESEERYRTLVELSPSGVVVFSEGRTVYINPTGAVLLGASAVREILDRPTFEFIHPDYHPEVRENVKRLLNGGVSVHSAERIYLKMDGTSIPVQVEAARIHWNGKPAILGLFSDITERKQAEQVLWRSRQAIRALHDIASAQGQSLKERVEALLHLGCRFFDTPIGMETFIRGEALEVGQVNAPGTAFHPGMSVPLGKTYCSETLRQSGTLSFEHAGASPEWRRHPAYAALKLESYIGTVINGRERTYGTLCFANTEPRAKRFTEAERDFIQLMARWLGGELDRQSTLDALRQSEERYRTLYDETPSMYFTVDGTGILRSVNQYGAQYLGYRVEDLVEKSVASIFFEEDRARVCAEMEAFFRRPEGVAQWEFRKVRSDGSVLWVRELARVLQNRVEESLALIVCEDITERKQAEKALADLNATLEQQVGDRTQALRQSEERFRQFFDNAPNLTALKDHHGQYVYTNRRFDEVFRLDPGTALGKTDRELFSPQQAEQFESHDRQVLAGGRGQEFEEVAEQEDGPHTSIVVKFPVSDAAGRLSAIGVIATDVTERNRTQEALRESEARWQQFAESVGSAFWIADVTPDERKVLYVNSAFTCIWGIEREEIYRNWSLWLDSIHPDDRTRVKAHHEGFVGGGAAAVFHCEYRIVGRDGHVRWISDRRVRMAGREHRIAGIAEDITHHKQQLALMAQTEAIGNIGGWELDFLTNRLWWSDETYRLYDTTPELYSPTVETAVNFCMSDSRSLIAEALRKGAEQGTPWDLELELLTAKGRRVTVRVVGKVDVVKERAVRAYGTFQDITDRKRSEEALQRAHGELERKVMERTAELQASQERYARATAIGKVGVWELDVIRGEYHADANLKALFGYAPEELSTDPFVWLDLVCREDQPIAMKNWELVQSGAADACHYELRMVKKDGSMVWTDVRCHSVRDQDGRLTHLIGATVDVTERKQAEQALRESEERFSKAFRTSPHPIGITEVATGRCIEVNDACLELFGFRREEVIGSTTLMLGIWPNLEDRVRVIERLKAGQPVRNMEFALKIKSGALRYLLASADLAELNGTLCVVTIANDITDRKQAEEALRRSEERFAKAFQASPNPVVISELDSGLVVDANDAACQLFAYSKEEVVGRTTQQIGLWPSTEARDRYLELLLSQGSVRNVEVALRSKSGEVRQCLLSAELIELNGKQCSVTVGDDITESKRLEKALRLTQFSVDQAVEAIVWLDPHARIFNVNDAACDMLEYSREQLLAMTVHDIDPNFPVERWAEHWHFLKQQGALTFDAKFWSRTGNVLETDVTVNYLQYDGQEYGCMILRDVAERKQAEAELHRSHRFLRQVIDTDPDLIFARDRDGRFALANKALADWYGTTVEALIGKSDSDFNVNAEEVEFFRRSDLEVFSSGMDRFILEERITDAGGRTRWLQTVKRPIFDDHGQVHMVLGAATDITERKRMEEILLQRERDLSAALQERERISQDLHDGILQALYAVGLGLEACKPLIKKQRDPMAEKFRATLDQAIGQLNQVMTEVRNFIAGLESQVLQGGDFSTALRTMVETMSIASFTKCRVRIDEAAARRLSTEQALHIINIVREGVSNALRHSRAKHITVSLRDLIRSDRLAVTDDGIGFNTRSVQGIGHGLANMAARAQKVRGLFAIQSKPDKGTRVSLDLPKDTPYAHT